jgi:hypothetical protein
MSDGLQSLRGQKLSLGGLIEANKGCALTTNFGRHCWQITVAAVCDRRPLDFGDHGAALPGGTPQFGLIAEEVAKVNPDLVIRDDKGDIYTVRYDAVNAMLLNEFLKEHRKVEDQTNTIRRTKIDRGQATEGFSIQAHGTRKAN